MFSSTRTSVDLSSSLPKGHFGSSTILMEAYSLGKI